MSRWLLLAFFLAVTLLELRLLPHQSLWIDEIFSLAMATGHSLEHPAVSADPRQGDFIEPSSAMTAAEWQKYLTHERIPASPTRVLRAALLSDTSPPLYYLALYLWTIFFGTSDFALRSLSVVFALASYPFFVALARRSGGARSVLPACILFPLAPLVFYYATEGRMYSLVLLTLSATAWSTLSLQEKGSDDLRSLLWIGTGAAGLLTHYFFLFPWAGMLLFLLLRPGQLKRRQTLLLLLPVIVLVAPWYVTAFTYQAHLRGGTWFRMHRPPGDLAKATVDQLLQSFSGDSYGLWKSESGWVHLSLLLVGCICLVAIIRQQGRLFQGARLLLWLWFLGAAMAPAALDLITGSFMSHHPRYALGAAPAGLLLLSAWLADLGTTGLLCAAMLLASWIPALRNIWRQDSRVGEPFPTLVQALTPFEPEKMVVIVDSIPTGVLGVARYASKNTAIASWVAPLGTRVIPDSLVVDTRGYDRVLFINTHGFHDSTAEEAWLHQHYETFETRSLAAFTITDFRSTKIESSN